MAVPFVPGDALGWATLGLNAVSAFNEPSSPSRGGAREDVRYGHQVDQEYRLGGEQIQYDRAIDRGMTPQEYYGSSASGAPNVSGGAAVLGNNRTQLDSQAAQAKAQFRNAAAERANKIVQTKMQTDAQIKTAEISSGATIRGQDIVQKTQLASQNLTKLIAENNYKLAKQRLENVDTPRLLQELKISDQKFKLLTNQIATSKPKFMLYMKKLSMGVDNMMVEFLQHSYGINITDPKSIQKLSPQQRAQFIQHVAGINSHAFKEASGIGLAAKGVGTDIIKGLGTILQPSNTNPTNLGNVKNQKSMSTRQSQRDQLIGQ